MISHRNANDDALFVRLCTTLTGNAPLTAVEFRILESIAGRHSLRALLRDRTFARCAQHGHVADPDGTALTDTALREAALETQRNASLVDIIEALALAGVPALIFKGTALAHSHYPRPELRERADTDLAVDRAHLPTAGCVLERLGFRAMAANEGSLIMRQRLYRRRDTHGLLHNIDLHWAISNSARTARLGVRDLIARSVALTALGTHARMPDAIDALLIACAHLDAHHVGDVRLVWLYDIHLIIDKMPLAIRVDATRRAIAYDLVPACGWVLAALARTLDSSLAGFEPLTAHDNIAPPGARRASQWRRELVALADNRTRLIWLSQHMIADTQFLRSSANANTPLWRLHLARLLRGITHLAR